MMDFITAGRITKEAVNLARKNIREGVNIYDYVKKIEDFIKKKGAGLAFPVNISINEYAAHDTADYESNKIFQSGQVVKVDIGAEVNGYVGDSAFTSEIKTKEYSDLILASEKALSEALKIIKPGIKLREIGAVINNTISMFGYNPIKNLGGHGVGKYSLHTGIFIPNYDNHDNHELKEDDMVAIEPFATTGKGSVVSSNSVKIHSFTAKKPVRSPGARKIQEYIMKNFNTLPFAEHQLQPFFKPSEIRFGIAELIRADALHSYPLLREASKGVVSQAEHTILVKDKPIITTN